MNVIRWHTFTGRCVCVFVCKSNKFMQNTFLHVDKPENEQFFKSVYFCLVALYRIRDIVRKFFGSYCLVCDTHSHSHSHVHVLLCANICTNVCVCDSISILFTFFPSFVSSCVVLFTSLLCVAQTLRAVVLPPCRRVAILWRLVCFCLCECVCFFLFWPRKTCWTTLKFCARLVARVCTHIRNCEKYACHAQRLYHRVVIRLSVSQMLNTLGIHLNVCICDCIRFSMLVCVYSFVCVDSFASSGCCFCFYCVFRLYFFRPITLFLSHTQYIISHFNRLIAQNSV